MSASIPKRLPKTRTAALLATASDTQAGSNTRPLSHLSRIAPGNNNSTNHLNTGNPLTTITNSPRTFATQTNINNNHTVLHKQLIARNVTTNTNTIAKMSTMPAQHGHSEACCNIPPIVSNYTAKGSYEEVGGYKSYVAGPASATKGVVVVYDIFGYYPQTLQGADIMATSDHATNYKILMPDWFKGNPCPLEWFPPTTEEKQKLLGGFFANNSPAGVAEQLPAYVKAAQAKFPEVKDWAVLGYCWGGKVVALSLASPSNPFKAGVSVHPAMVDPKDAEHIKAPLILLASKDENPEDVKQFEAKLTGAPKHVETFADQIHGWMAARADLDDERVKSEYKRGYEAVLTFLSKHL
ncbi:alpha/beta-hydrolase [Xylaria sp. CBS 124048]|nr:alpha/beta-hydrolase [Xylaria sp. CBS 124048]